MGRMGAISINESVNNNEITLENALRWHLIGNHYPPVPVSMVKPCIRAIKKANAGQWKAHIRLPEGVTWRGKKLAPVVAIIEGHHLESFLDNEDDEE